MTALKAMTLWPAYQHFEESTKGSIEVGKLADFVILSRDPTKGDVETIDRIKITETVKEGSSFESAVIPSISSAFVFTADMWPDW